MTSAVTIPAEYDSVIDTTGPVPLGSATAPVTKVPPVALGLLGIGLILKLAALVEAVPQCVLRGAGLAMFGATGARILGAVDFANNRNNLFVVAVSVGFGMIPLVVPTFFRRMPHALHPLLESGIPICAIVAVTLNLFFNGLTSSEAANHQAASSEH